ncbi:hypothetical protein ACFLRF_05240 [Candidatus Altiarchaeota archaeon]
MEVDRFLFIKAFVITVIIFLSVYSLNLYLNSERERVLDERMSEIIVEFEEFQALSALMRVYGRNATCLTLRSRMKHLDKRIWELGEKIDKYRELSKEYMDDPYYQEQKEKFNRQEVIYLALLKQMKTDCKINQTEILYFYRKSEDCPDCDAQAYVLDYFNRLINQEVAIFSFDADMQMASVQTLIDIHNITSYPCVVVEGQSYCGMRDRVEMEKIFCSKASLSIC